jgi:UDP:flavonoid glycosyltransferase YjiC (YdhE family)
MESLESDHGGGSKYVRRDGRRGARSDAQYICPLLGVPPNTIRPEWPEGDGPKVFAFLRPDTSHVQAILGALAMITARVICVAQGFWDRQLASFRKPHILFYRRPVDLAALRDADLCISYGAEGTMLSFLLAGTPQLISPWHVEAFMAAREIQRAGFGLALEGKSTAQSIANTVTCATRDPVLRRQVAEFSARTKSLPADRAARAVVEQLYVLHQLRGKLPEDPSGAAVENIAA